MSFTYSQLNFGKKMGPLDLHSAILNTLYKKMQKNNHDSQYSLSCEEHSRKEEKGYYQVDIRLTILTAELKFYEFDLERFMVAVNKVALERYKKEYCRHAGCILTPKLVNKLNKTRVMSQISIADGVLTFCRYEVTEEPERESVDSLINEEVILEGIREYINSSFKHI